MAVDEFIAAFLSLMVKRLISSPNLQKIFGFLKTFSMEG